jgi:hypothetical protein
VLQDWVQESPAQFDAILPPEEHLVALHAVNQRLFIGTLPHQFYQISSHAQEQQIPTKTKIIVFPSMKSTSM